MLGPSGEPCACLHLEGVAGPTSSLARFPIGEHLKSRGLAMTSRIKVLGLGGRIRKRGGRDLLAALAVLVFIVGLICAAPVRAQDASVRWVTKPSGPDMAQFYPERAQRLEKNGFAKAVCEIAEDRTLTNCAIAVENPEGFGFGAAVLKLTRFYQAAPDTPVGTKVTTPMTFTLQATKPTPH